MLLGYLKLWQNDVHGFASNALFVVLFLLLRATVWCPLFSDVAWYFCPRDAMLWLWWWWWWWCLPLSHICLSLYQNG